MSETAEVTRIEKIGDDGRTNNSALFVSPPISGSEWSTLTGPRHETSEDIVTEAQKTALNNLSNARIMSKFSLLFREVEIDGTKGSILFYDAGEEDKDKDITAEAAYLGEAIRTMRGQKILELALSPQE